MARRIYSEAELYSELEFARPHQVAGQRLHGGFDAAGHYLPPRAKGRNAALAAWIEGLEARGGALFAADASLLTGPRMPNVEQQRLLLRRGIGAPFWNSLTITGKIEGRGRVLAEMTFPDLQNIVTQDISEMAIGHLNRGLLSAHGIDEGGEPERGIGGHDVMWFVARDLVFGADAYPDVEPPESISRPEAGRRWMPGIGPEFEGLLSFLMNLLLIEFRAEIGFANTQDIFRTPDLFRGRRAEAEEAAQIVERIRTDEEIHVRSLRLYLGELRQLDLRTLDGSTVAGAELIDPFWDGLVRWATVEQPRLAAQAQYQLLKPQILAHPQGGEVLAEFDALSDVSPADLDVEAEASAG
ncbi:MAG: hypothetical protein ACNA7W_19985 [Pseudomonadales bacterium]